MDGETPIVSRIFTARQLVLSIPLGASTDQIAARVAHALEAAWTDGYIAGKGDVLADVTGH